MIKRQQQIIDIKTERKIITYMITNTIILSQVEKIYTSHSLRSPYTQHVAQWCIEYFREYKQAPFRHIEELYYKNGKQLQEETKELIGEFLDGLSIEYENEYQKVINTEYLLDEFEEYFRVCNIIYTKNEIEKNLSLNNIDDAENSLTQYCRVVRPETKGIDVFGDIESVRNALQRNTTDTLYRLNGELGELIGEFRREYLCAIIGRPGIGKTWWLLYFALRAVHSGLNVLFVSMEMSEGEILQRIFQSVTKTVIPSKRTENIKTISIPALDEEDNIIEIHKKKREFNVDIATIAQKKINKMLRGAKFKIIEYPSRSITFEDFRTHLQNMEYYEGFIPDVIVTDYADKFLVKSRYDYRLQMEQVWDAHKALAQEKHIFVVTASQTNTARTGADIKQGDWAESISKLNLIDVGIALNQNDEEKRQGVMRVKILKQRHGHFDLDKEVKVLYSYVIGSPYLDSYSQKE